MSEQLLRLDHITMQFGGVIAVNDLSLEVNKGEIVAVVGASGSGKSTSAMAVLGLLPGTGHVVGGSIKRDGQEIAGLKQKDYDRLRGSKMGLVPQDPMSNLNPVWRIGTQVKEALVANNMDFDAVCLSVGQHKCDIAMAGLTVKPDREEYVTFSKSYYNASQKLIVKADDTTFDACPIAAIPPD